MDDKLSRTCVHLVEPGGRGGVFQHTVAVALALHEAGVPVVVHTASDAELTLSGPEQCGCVRWNRALPGGMRQIVTASRFLVRTVPHLVTCVGGQDIVHVQGLFHPFLTAALVASLRGKSLRVAHSPHNTFARSGSVAELAVIKWVTRRANVVFALTAADVQILRSWGVDPVKAELMLHMPRPDPNRVVMWRARYGPGRIALLAGQVRPDKQPEVFLEAVAEVRGVRPAVVGEDCGAEGVCVETARRLGLDMLRISGYLSLEDFGAAIAAADVVVATNVVASGSGSIAHARALGVRSVAARVGGLAEQAMVVADRPDKVGFSAAISRALAEPAPVAEEPSGASLARETLAGYSVAGWRHE